MQSINTASIAILSAFGVTYVIDRMRDKQDRNLREEIKERVFDSLKENTERVRAMEQKQEQLAAKIATRDDIEKIVAERIEQYDNGRFVGDQKNKSISLKLNRSKN
mmetsp:Transcript_45597/g.33344  ORF Transcript_45597/g.33344 Transcript_45597/m.33344 type:complete len:106 (+) Transcript_45597:167-484(+)|eukprot:CAMPEP_0202966728 /NCGR_PEP_ID=MMETSP1396-20130829/11283_1 /ASSEMBLY_ACC=CAM_ASM_000872 /TAXON_ID= /ORGANISM="Pseudokeronopsis sp., Strain Brazil" /LENGTH=105 /DNA_ID=CAMNT_0049690945 /DNA_START=162 /DNA_END=479 /DNA_ORIENTATION=+